MCRNWELFGKCKFQDKCSFAHGDHELMKKVHLPSNYKTKPCIQFHTTSYCPYGNRCQFLHSQYDIYNNLAKEYSQILNENVRLSGDRANSLKEGQELLTYVSVFPTKRLNVFKNIVPACTTTNWRYSHRDGLYIASSDWVNYYWTYVYSPLLNYKLRLTLLLSFYSLSIFST